MDINKTLYANKYRI